tara:strand:+ start:327 stop:518 length:192 start_codon:yes stop_codon:yes gene_type:complete
MKDRILENYISLVRSLREDAPTMSMGGGGIAGSKEAGDEPPVRKKKKYIYQKGLRKWWKQFTN